jgi:hypothetical protein
VPGRGRPGWWVNEAFNVSADSWAIRLPSLPTPRIGLSAVSLGGLLYAIGGAPIGAASTDVVEAYNPVTQQWSSKARMTTPRAYTCVHACAAASSKRGDSITHHAVVVAATAAAACSCAAAYNGLIYVIAGTTGDASESLTSIEVWRERDAHGLRVVGR